MKDEIIEALMRMDDEKYQGLLSEGYGPHYAIWRTKSRFSKWVVAMYFRYSLDV